MQHSDSMGKLAQIEVAGHPQRRGQQYGEDLRNLIRERDRRWKAEIGDYTGIVPIHFIEEFLSSTRFVDAIVRHAPDLMDEVRGLAEGANIEFRDALAAQFMDEEWWFTENRKTRAHHCSSLGYVDPRTGTGILGQTMDLPAWMDGFQTLLTVHAPETGLSAHILTVAGMIGLCGVNSAGLALAVNTLSDLAVSRRGLPVAFVARRILDHTTCDGACAFVAAVEHASGQNYIIADRRRIVDMECSANACAGFAPDGANPGMVWHANHALANDDRRSRADGDPIPAEANSLARMDALNRLLQQRDSIDFETAQNVLGNRNHKRYPICRELDLSSPPGAARYFSFATVAWELGENAVAHVAPGPLTKEAFQTFLFEGKSLLLAAD